jgi:Spy/CpxP family protein refolding chaperone
LRAAFDQMHSLLQQDPPDETAIMQQADKIGALQTEEHKGMLHTLLQVRAELTPEQRKKLLEMKDRDAPRWHRRGGPRGPE